LLPKTPKPRANAIIKTFSVFSGALSAPLNFVLSLKMAVPQDSSCCWIALESMQVSPFQFDAKVEDLYFQEPF